MNPRARSVYFSIFMVCFPRPAAPAPKAQAPHLHWVSARRIDVPQPAAVVFGRRSPAWRKCGHPVPKFEEVERKFGHGEVRRNLLPERMTETPAEITGIYRYPVKGLSPEPLPRVALAPGGTLPADRRYAIENGPSGFDAADPKWMSKAYFLMLQRDEWLAGLHSHFDDASHALTIHEGDREVARGDLETAEGRGAIERFLAARFGGQIKGPPKILSSRGHSFSDVAKKV